jgi:hypothetical protein
MRAHGISAGDKRTAINRLTLYKVDFSHTPWQMFFRAPPPRANKLYSPCRRRVYKWTKYLFRMRCTTTFHLTLILPNLVGAVGAFSMLPKWDSHRTLVDTEALSAAFPLPPPHTWRTDSFLCSARVYDWARKRPRAHQLKDWGARFRQVVILWFLLANFVIYVSNFDFHSQIFTIFSVELCIVQSQSEVLQSR